MEIPTDDVLAEALNYLNQMLFERGYAIFILPLAVALAGLLMYVADEFNFSWRNLIPAKKSSPMIAYKKAQLLPNGDFQGVMGGGYSVDSEKRPGSIGFHAYEDFERAREHPQEANVMLEVLLSGNIMKHEDGYVASHQRVLQVIPHRCSYYCERVPTHFYKDQNEIWFTCSLHKVEGHILRFSRARSEFKPIEQLSNSTPKLKEARVVTSRLKGASSFIPTKLQENSVT